MPTQKFDVQQGIICSLTGRQADFQDYCPTFKGIDGSDPVLAAYEGKSSFDPQVSMASGTKRFINLIVDYIVFYVIVIFVGAISGVIVALFFPENLGELESDKTPVWAYVLSFTLYVGYYTLLEASSGRTIGKLFTGTRVVDKDGKTPDAGTIFRRSLTRCIPFEAFSFLSNSRGWHDKWTDTWVVEKK
ncbi:MAG TPA: RDD family protein [Cytophagales bacterium]|nr:RDD family protein [Cytophagales bacterium]HCR53344.1 RDD family protein [Cytophagales bacterium]